MVRLVAYQSATGQRMFYPQATLPLSRERVLMGGVAYKSAKEGVGTILSVPQFTAKECPGLVYSNSMPSKEIIGHNWGEPASRY